jgi:hypothetical protein
MFCARLRGGRRGRRRSKIMTACNLTKDIIDYERLVVTRRRQTIETMHRSVMA